MYVILEIFVVLNEFQNKIISTSMHVYKHRMVYGCLCVVHDGQHSQ
jgi:hypothetical protein